MPIPDLPGTLVQHGSEQELWLKQHVARLCQLNHERFPGSQPVSFGMKDMEKLESQDYWVCEKSDGIRVLLLVHTNLKTEVQGVYLIDRHNSYRQLDDLFFPHHENPKMPLRNTIVDGELVIDIDPRTKQETMRYLAFDCLVVDEQNVMSRPLDKRYGRLQEWFYKPYFKMLRDYPKMAQGQPFEIRVKDVKFSYHVPDVFEKDIPALQHGNDGLIYTCVNTPYIAGTDPNILKWKPPSENSIDFKLLLRFPPDQSGRPDFYSKPIFELQVWCGGSQYELYDVMLVTDEEWESLKSSGEQLDERIVEVHWSPELDGWRMMRFRNDKPNGNHKNVVDNIIKTIADGVDKDALLARSNAIRNAWKTRQSQAQNQAASRTAQPPPGSSHLPPKPPPQTSSSFNPNVSRPATATSAAAASLPARPISRSSAVPDIHTRYGPLLHDPRSKVEGPLMVMGIHR